MLYAFESKRKKTEEALFAYRKFAKMGIEQWIQSITGWSNEPIEPPLPDLTLPREAVRILKNSQETKTAYDKNDDLIEIKRLYGQTEVVPTTSKPIEPLT